MFEDDFIGVTKSAVVKSTLLHKNPLGYFVAAMLAGMYVGFGVLLAFSIGGMLADQIYVKIAMGLSFGIALSCVVIAGAELFTGNNLVMAVGGLGGSVNWRQVAKVWIVSYFGNWAGSIVLAFMFWGAGLANGPTGEFIASISEVKMHIPVLQLFIRGILCNILVCIAIWSSFRCKSESAKLIIIFWCLFAFITSNFEHSVANMTLLTIAMLSPFQAAISWGGYFYNIIIATLGNMVGGVLFIAVPYFLISRKKEERCTDGLSNESRKNESNTDPMV